MPNEISFENAMERLETIVEEMESGELALEALLERYEEGTRMVKVCTQKLAAAEKKIEIINRKAAAQAEVPSSEEGEQLQSPKSSRSAKVPANPPPSDDDISLF